MYSGASRILNMIMYLCVYDPRTLRIPPVNVSFASNSHTYLKDKMWICSDSEDVKNICCSSRGPEFNSHPSHTTLGSSQLPVTPGSGNLVLSSSLCRHQQSSAHTHTEVEIHTHNQNYFFKAHKKKIVAVPCFCPLSHFHCYY